MLCICGIYIYVDQPHYKTSLSFMKQEYDQ